MEMLLKMLVKNRTRGEMKSKQQADKDLAAHQKLMLSHDFISSLVVLLPQVRGLSDFDPTSLSVSLFLYARPPITTSL